MRENSKTAPNFECETGVTVSEMLGLNLKIPDYQRPYKWKEENVSELFSDILDAMNNEKIKAYRIGTIILHKEKNKEIYNIVDGQQRIISLHLLLIALGQPPLRELEVPGDSAGITRVHAGRNSKKLKSLIKRELTDKDIKNKYIDFLKDKCEFVKITTPSEEQAFQFFDSQNNRGKELELYDILKAYHLRVMDADNKNDTAKDNSGKKNAEMHKVVERWEKSEPRLQRLFNEYLYQIKQWVKSKDGNTSKWKMDNEARFFELFKGFKSEHKDRDRYRYEQYHLGTNREFRQIDMPVISGRAFFDDVFGYRDIQEEIDKMCFKRFKGDLTDLILPGKSDKSLVFRNVGNKYIYYMMECALLFIATKFDKNTIWSEPVQNKIFAWAWSLRLYFSRINKQTINNYSLGFLGDEETVKMFDIIGNSTTLRQILDAELDPLLDLPPENKKKYRKLAITVKNYLSGDLSE